MTLGALKSTNSGIQPLQVRFELSEMQLASRVPKAAR